MLEVALVLDLTVGGGGRPGAVAGLEQFERVVPATRSAGSSEPQLHAEIIHPVLATGAIERPRLGSTLLSTYGPIGKARLRAASWTEREDNIDPRPPRRSRSVHLEADQSASDLDQTAADSDQTASDTDQSLADRDQAASEADQRVSDRDQAASDREWEVGPAPDPTQLRVHEQAQVSRGEGTMARMATTAVRAQVASDRDEQARRRDEVASHRDEVAAARDREAEEVDGAAEEMAGEFGEDSPAAKVAAVARATAAAARASAARDRERAARDREDAARDRELLMGEIESSHVDESTGAYGRRTGEVLLRHEVERAQSTKLTLTLGLVCIDGPGQVGDRHDGSIDDALARDLFRALQETLRPYDPIVRWFDNEFVCAVAGMAQEDVGSRIEIARSSVVKRNRGASTAVGFATLEDGDTLDNLVERARSTR